MHHEADTHTVSNRAMARWPGIVGAAYPVVATLIGVLLLAAALLKLAGGTADSLGQNAALFFPAARMVSVQAELLLGLWLLSSWQARAARWAAMGFFAAMAAVSLWLALQGQSTCGCFGRIAVHPWATLGLDLAALVAFALLKPNNAGSGPGLLSRGVVTATFGAVVLLTASALGMMAYWQADLATVLARLRGETVRVHPALTDLGRGRRGEWRAFDVWVKNHSDQPIRLAGGSSDCACVATEELPCTVPPRGMAVITVHARFTGTTGLFQHEYVLVTDDTNQPFLIARFTGQVEKPD
ncbi:MAG: hypothetical protein U0797_26075 [Gemmataceae bacterium]